MDFIANKARDFRELHVIQKIATDNHAAEADFYLTSSPFCSSLLAPDGESLSDWAFAHLFEVEKKIRLPAVNLRKTLDDLHIGYVDWFKADTQGLDLRLFKNMGNRQQGTIVADLEPGFINAYRGEDKIADMLAYMTDLPFWLCSFMPGGNQKMNIGLLENAFSAAEISNIRDRTATAAVFAGATYVNNFKEAPLQTERGYLLGCVCALVLKQYGFAAELALKGRALTGNPLFEDIISHIKESTKKASLRTLLSRPGLLKTKIINTLIRKLDQAR